MFPSDLLGPEASEVDEALQECSAIKSLSAQSQGEYQLEDTLSLPSKAPRAA